VKSPCQSQLITAGHLHRLHYNSIIQLFLSRGESTIARLIGGRGGGGSVGDSTVYASFAQSHNPPPTHTHTHKS
jgi:hypothetical protein